MATCKDCLHHDACKKLLIALFPTIPVAAVEEVTNRECDCKTFKSAADVVEVVRCKDCKHYSFAQSLKRYECNIFNGAYEFIGYPTKPNDFCRYGERKNANCD